jgi:hypothetical protein
VAVVGSGESTDCKRFQGATLEGERVGGGQQALSPPKEVTS